MPDTLADLPLLTLPTAAPATDTTAPRLLILYTGGTIGMVVNTRQELVPMHFSKLDRLVPELRQLPYRLELLTLPQLIDSSNVTPTDWLRLAQLIKQYYSEFDGFVVLHGTDTMAYSAAALSFLLEHLGKPVIFTGAQVPVGRTRSDAARNLLTALEIAAARHPQAHTVQLPEVGLFFDDILIRGNRAKKVESQQFAAFRSENYPPLVRAGINLTFADNDIRLLPSARLKVHERLDENVAVLRLFPGITAAVVEAVLGVPGLRGCVLETYGSGNAPTAPWFLQCLERARQRGVYILNVSQCEEGRVVQGRYETSAHLTNLGVIGGDDITSEAAITKLMFVLGIELDETQTRALLSQDLRGEITPQ
ncbi:type I asparaginase [Hymenobacter setariae]|uniref:asparaginase n=1 Tax=Hymenobacter setariae TaxID=2594794 RepID=A0A558C2X5_9BACT|nr:type I asparaginase [Hymenobacter setariae]TVT43138.1 type I asparaginase [Hymenobacter setariae]